MTRFFITLFVMVFSSFMLLISLFNQQNAFEINHSQVAVTTDACNFAQSVGMKTTNMHGICSIIGEFSDNLITGGGTLKQNNYEIDLKSNQIIGTAKIPDQNTKWSWSTWNDKQKRAVALTTGSLALLVVSFGNMLKLMFLSTKSKD